MEPGGSCLTIMFVNFYTQNLRVKFLIKDTSLFTTLNMVVSVLFVFPY